jgi:L-threonylcarbamoyladenylate synthase
MSRFINDIQNCLETLGKGGLILYPTDTIWGVGCDATNAESVTKIYQLKKRGDEKSMIVLVADEKEVTQYVNDPDPAIFDYLRKMDRPVTVVYANANANADDLAQNLVARDGSIAIRICKDDFCRELINNFGKPIVSSSANFSGEPAPGLFSQINKELKKGVNYIVQYRQDDPQRSLPSMLIRWEQGQPIILRA